MEQRSNNQSQTPQPPPASPNINVPLSFIQNILVNMQRTQPQVPNSPPSNHHSHTNLPFHLPNEALPQTEAKPMNVIDLDDEPMENVPSNFNMNDNHVGQEMQNNPYIQGGPLVEEGQIINNPEVILSNNCLRTEQIIQQEKPKEIIEFNNNQNESYESQKIISSELHQHIESIPIEISSISQAPSISIIQSVHNNQQNNNLYIPPLSNGEPLPAQQIVNVEMETNRSPLANITNHPSFGFRGVQNFIDSTIPNIIQIIEQRPTPDFNAQTALNQQPANDNSENLPPLVLPNPQILMTQMDIQVPQPQPQRQPDPQLIAEQEPEPIVQNNQIIEIIEDQQIKLVQKIEQNNDELIQVSHIENRQVEPSNIPNIQENLTQNDQKENNIVEPGEINLCEVQNSNIHQAKQIQIHHQMNHKQQEGEIQHKQIVIVEDSPQEQQIENKKPQISSNEAINVPNQLQLQFPSICNDSPELTDINEIRKLLLTYLPPHLQELTQSLDDRQLRQMYLDIRAEQMKLSAQNVQNAPISQNAQNTNNIIHIQQNPIQISNRPVQPVNSQEKKKQAPKPSQPKKATKSNQPTVNQTPRQEKKDVTINITQIHETHNNQGKSATDSNKKGKKVKKQRKRIVTTVVQQVEYFDDSDNEIPSKYCVLENGETKRKKPANKAQMQSILTQLCSLVKSLDLASVGNNTTQ